MKLSRRYRLLTVFAALLGMLFMQLALASHACPGTRAVGGGIGVVEAVQPPMASMPDCDQQPDADPAALCHAHCQDAKASLDKADPPAASPAAVVVSAILRPPGLLARGSSADFERRSFLQRTTAPPLSIRHCCLRI